MTATTSVSRKFVIEEASQRERFKSFLDRRELPFMVEIGPVREQRSIAQNARLWSLHQLASKETGHSPDELHEIMLCKFFGTKEVDFAGVKRTVPLKRSSTREKQEFREFLDNVENFYAAECGVWLGKDE